MHNFNVLLTFVFYTIFNRLFLEKVSSKSTSYKEQREEYENAFCA